MLKLELSYGSNARTVQYFDVRNGLTSEVFDIASAYADFFAFDSYNDSAFIAYPDVDDKVHYHETANVHVIVADVFNGDEYRIERDFISLLTGVNNMVFLSSNELYIDYEIIDGATREERFSENKGTIENVREIVNFR